MKLSPQQIALIEFANNGVVDSLTESMAPSRFFTALAREGVIARRSGAQLLVISARLNLDTFLQQYFDPLSSERFAPRVALAHIEQEMQRIGKLLATQVRVGDFYTRFSDIGFLILIRGSDWEFELAAKRIAVEVNGLGSKSGFWSFSEVRPEPVETLSHLKSRIDRLHFS